MHALAHMQSTVHSAQQSIYACSCLPCSGGSTAVPCSCPTETALQLPCSSCPASETQPLPLVVPRVAAGGGGGRRRGAGRARRGQPLVLHREQGGRGPSAPRRCRRRGGQRQRPAATGHAAAAAEPAHTDSGRVVAAAGAVLRRRAGAALYEMIATLSYLPTYHLVGAALKR